MNRNLSIIVVSVFGSIFGACSVKSQSDISESLSLVNIDVKVTGLKKGSQNSPSQLCYAVFNSPEGFPSDSTKVVKEGCLPVDAESLEFTIKYVPSLKKGFVVSVFQDLNMSKKMETKKFFGFDVPAEPFGFTKNPSLMSGAPSFEKCKITGMAGEVHEIILKTM